LVSRKESRHNFCTLHQIFVLGQWLAKWYLLLSNNNLKESCSAPAGRQIIPEEIGQWGTSVQPLKKPKAPIGALPVYEQN
jgi:hypothetical protein